MRTVASAIEDMRTWPPDEPVFILRAQDVTAPYVIGYWCQRATEVGVNLDKRSQACDQAVRMLMWNGTKKVPD